MARNEKAQYQPQLVTPESREEAIARAKSLGKSGGNHGKGCGCGSDTHPDRSSLRQKAVLMADGSKVFPSQRPWMISH